MDPLNDFQYPQLELQSAHLEAMRAWVAARAPEEACGLLGGKDGRVFQVIGVENELHSPYRYRMEPTQQLKAFQAFDDSGLELLGIFHSHPAGPPELSPTDIAEAYYPEAIQLVWSLVESEWKLQTFRIISGEVQRASVEVAAQE